MRFVDLRLRGLLPAGAARLSAKAILRAEAGQGRHDALGRALSRIITDPRGLAGSLKLALIIAPAMDGLGIARATIVRVRFSAAPVVNCEPSET